MAIIKPDDLKKSIDSYLERTKSDDLIRKIVASKERHDAEEIERIEKSLLEPAKPPRPSRYGLWDSVAVREEMDKRMDALATEEAKRRRESMYGDFSTLTAGTTASKSSGKALTYEDLAEVMKKVGGTMPSREALGIGASDISAGTVKATHSMKDTHHVVTRDCLLPLGRYVTSVDAEHSTATDEMNFRISLRVSGIEMQDNPNLMALLKLLTTAPDEFMLAHMPNDAAKPRDLTPPKKAPTPPDDSNPEFGTW